VPTDSQGEAEALERKLLNIPLKLSGSTGTCAEKWAQDFVKNPNESIEKSSQILTLDGHSVRSM